jgi:hypothetical protein
MGAFAGLVLLAAIGCAYFLPSFVASQRKVPNVGSVMVINALLGWTVVGWVVALAMACRDVPAQARHAPPRWPNLQPSGGPPPPCYRCGAAADLHAAGKCPAPEISR